MNVEIEIDVSKLLIADERNFLTVANAALREAANQIVQEAKKNIDPSRSGLHNISFNLSESVKISKYVQLSPNSIGEATIKAGGTKKVPYAAIHETGGIIKPKKSKYLTFAINGKWIRTKQVVIPQRAYMEPAMMEVVNRFDEIFRDKFEEILNSI